MDISYPKKTRGILTYFSLTAMRLASCTLKDGVFRTSGIKIFLKVLAITL
ncbi:hypothetical protein [Helicobacter pylori]|nr:hypothetical protein [Helicobacter pylori]